MSNVKKYVTVNPISFAVEGLTLRASAYMPEGKGPWPVALLLHGFSDDRNEMGLFVDIGRELASRGIAVITYDRAGHGESDGVFFDTSVSKDVRQAKQIVEQISRLSWADMHNFHEVGLSLGAVIASLLAAEGSVQPRSLTLISNAAAFADEIRGGHIQGAPTSVIETQGYFDFWGMKMGPAMIEDAKAIDIYPRAAKFGGKVLILHGTKDFIPIRYAEKYKEIYGDRAELLVREGAGHGFRSVPDEQFALQRITDFITACADLV